MNNEFTIKIGSHTDDTVILTISRGGVSVSEEVPTIYLELHLTFALVVARMTEKLIKK